MDEEEFERMRVLDRIGQAEERLQPEPDYFESELARFNKFLIQNDEQLLPMNITEKFWAFMDKEVSLSNLSKDDIRYCMLKFSIAKINAMMSMPDYKLTFETIANIDQAELKTFLKAKRSIGGPDRERALIATQIKEIRMTEKEQKVRGNIFSRLFGGKQ